MTFRHWEDLAEIASAGQSRGHRVFPGKVAAQADTEELRLFRQASAASGQGSAQR
jgi:hypothetical protein